MTTERFATALLGALLIFAVSGIPETSPAQPLTREPLDKTDIEGMMESLSNWGRWGKDDELGALNLITAKKRMEALREARGGATVSLAHSVIKEPIQGSPPFIHKMTGTGRDPASIADGFQYSADSFSVEYHGYTQTHLDALCHLFYKGKMYNRFSQQDVTSKGAQALSVAEMKNGIITRGVLMDFPALFQVPYLTGHKAIYPEDLEAWEKKAGIKVGRGDALLIRIGRWARQEKEGAWPFSDASPGLHASCLPWLKRRDVALLGSDLATDVLPSGVEGFQMPVHWVAIVALGVPILDNLDLEALSREAQRRRRWSFLLLTAPLVVGGGTGSPVNPIAIF